MSLEIWLGLAWRWGAHRRTDGLVLLGAQEDSPAKAKPCAGWGWAGTAGAADTAERDACVVAAMADVMCGGSTPSPVTPEATAAALSVQAEARRRYLGVPDGVMAKLTPFDAFELEEILTQVVAGTNYFIKVRISPPGAPTEHIALRIFQPLPHTGAPPELVSMLRDEAVPTPLQYFE